MNYKEIFYSKYVSTHTSRIYNKTTVEDLTKNFIFYDSYFGNFLPASKQSKIVDLGCGNGSLIKWLSKNGFDNSIGIDISSEQINQGRELGISNIITGDVFSYLKDNKNSCDVIFAIDILEHMDKKEIIDFLEGIFLALKPGGIFVCQTVNAENILWGRLRHADFTHDAAFTKLSINQLLSVCGFSETVVFPQRPVIHGVKSFIRYVAWRVIEILLRAYLVIETGSSKNSIFTQNLIIKTTRSEK